LAPYLFGYFGTHYKEEFGAIVGTRVMQGPSDYNLVKGMLDVAEAFVSDVLEPLTQHQGMHKHCSWLVLSF